MVILFGGENVSVFLLRYFYYFFLFLCWTFSRKWLRVSGVRVGGLVEHKSTSAETEK